MFRLFIFSCCFLATVAEWKIRPKPTQGKILGGRNTDITDVPYQVSVHHNGSYECGGSIIGTKYILTAAHCVEDSEDEDHFSIRAGSNYFDKEGQEVDVVKIISHPDYDTDTADFDAAVLVLKESLLCGESVKIVSLSRFEPEEGDMVQISGWGSTGEGNDDANFLQSVSVPVVSKAVCIEKHDNDEDISDHMFCAGSANGEKDSCEGDSGGPAVVNGKLAGIVSWGEECGKQDIPGVYTNVASIRDWIEKQIEE